MVMNARHALVAIATFAVLVGLALIGLAFGQSLKAGEVALVVQHPLFDAGAGSLTSGLVFALVFLGFGRSSDYK